MTQFLRVLVCLWLLAGVALAVKGLLARAQPADLAIVLGNTVYPDGSPSPRLAARLDSAIQCYRKNLCGLIFVSGGVDASGTDEAVAMRAYLTQHGVDEGKIVVDNKGVDTWSTAHNASTLMRERGLSKALIVTQYFHLPRAMLALSRFGVRDVSGTYPRFWEGRDFYSIGREVPAFVWYFIRPHHAD